MCLILFAWKAHPDYPLVVAANRDEFFKRPATPAHWWPDAPELLAGRDLEAGGTWMGLSRAGHFAALTNYRDPTAHRPGTPTRGALVRDAITSDRNAIETLDEISRISARYAGFNLLACDGDTLAIHESTTGAIRALAPGVYGLSNHRLDTPWPKVKRARAAFVQALAHLPGEAEFLALLRDETAASDEHLPSTGVSLEWERWLSPAFIRAPGYGTRCSTLLLLGQDGRARLREWTWNEDSTLRSELEHRFDIATA